MGFYGKVNNKNATQFVIDKIYSSRVEMEYNLAEGNDEVFIGRYVLIEYGRALTQLFKTIVKIKEEDGTEKEEVRFYFSKLLNEESRARFLPNGIERIKEDYYKKNYVKENQTIYIFDENLQQEYYKCIGEDVDGYAVFEKHPDDYLPKEANIYFDNYSKDMLAYPDAGRGYDSTVWQKIYVDEAEKYVMIAELNSVVPTFDLTIDAPTEEPATPHFDADSTNVYYRLHVQPNWGFRVKPNASQSDDAEKKAIYFNKAGFEKKVRSYVDDNDIITMTKAQSGKEYNNSHNSGIPFDKAPADDIQELSISLPSIGNAISDVWDIVYSEGRNTNINWNSYDGLRLVHDEGSAGFSYTTEELDTVAASINSIHDLMGMIIVDNVSDVELADTDKIYYGDLGGKNEKGYYIKEKSYKYEEFAEGELEEYLKETEPLELTQFEANKYYNKTNTGFSLVTTSQYKEGTNYYILGIEDIVLDGDYEANKYFYLNEPSLNYIKDINNLPNENIQYYDIEFIPLTSLFYHPTPHVENEDGTYTGLFYIDNDNNLFKIDGVDDPDFDVNGNYFIGENYTFTEDYDANTGKPVITYDFPKQITVTLISFTYDENNKSGNYYYKDANGDYICLTNVEDIDDNIKYGRIVLTAKQRFYEPNLYYYKSNNDFIFSEGDFNENASYVVLTNIDEPIKNTFYEPNKYYYKDNFSIDRLDTNENMTPNREYFLKYFAYVFKDTRGILDKGAEWNSNVKTIPEEVTLAKREETYTWKKLEGFARTLNTIHGLIIRINNLLKFDDYLTRDNHTVQGCINVMNDIINTFATLLPGEIAIVDEYGRLASAPFETDDWIDLQVNDDSINHLISLTHIGPVEKPVRNETNKTPLFGETFEIEDWVFDDKGHKTNLTTHTVQIPKGSLSDENHNNADVITQLAFEPSTGKLETTRKNVGNLLLTDYTIGENNADVLATDTVNQAFGKLQVQIIDEEKARAEAVEAEVKARTEAIQALDVAEITTDTFEVFGAISETDGKISATKKKAGDLTLNGWTLGDGADINSVNDTDTINGAFGKVQRQLNSHKSILDALNGSSTAPGSVAYQIAQIVNENNNGSVDTLNEIAAWIVSDTTGAAKMQSDISTNRTDIEKLNNLVGAETVQTQINNSLIIDGVEKYTLATDFTGLTDIVNTTTEKVETLEAAVPAEKIAKWDAAETNVQSDWNENDNTSDAFIKNKPDLSQYVSIEAYNSLLDQIEILEGRIKAIEDLNAPPIES